MWLVLGHVLLAVVGLLLWGLFVWGAVRASGWAACAVLLVVAAFGFMMLMRWMPSSGLHAQAEPTPERHFPLKAVVAHRSCAVATVVLALVLAARWL
ncbi:hypothetical protein ACTVZO_00620 [Streptomyces sp. IBSNAI002]|uniref:hypothetical protein n=1 Tax=Streptomyces sp. IBSNAI002 TaxID=3457500 RepID=UPI003FD0ABE2